MLDQATNIPQRRGSPTFRGARWRGFALSFSLIAACLVLAGFTRTFFVPLAQGTFSRPWFVYVHGALFLGWVALLIAQAGLVFRRNVSLHRRLGMAAVLLIPSMATSGIAVALWSTVRDAGGPRDAANISTLFGEFMDMFMFSSFAAAAIFFRRRPAWHKRLIFLATLALLGAAVGRIPVLGNHANLVVTCMLLAIVAYDLRQEGGVQSITILAGAAFVLGVYTQNVIGGSPQWQSAGAHLISASRRVLTP